MPARLTKNAIVHQMTEARCRRDGGALMKITFKWPGRKPATHTYSPITGESMLRELKFNGAIVLHYEIINREW